MGKLCANQGSDPCMLSLSIALVAILQATAAATQIFAQLQEASMQPDRDNKPKTFAIYVPSVAENALKITNLLITLIGLIPIQSQKRIGKET